MSVTHTDARIRKLWAKGSMTVEQIARKIGRPNAAGKARVERVVIGLDKGGVPPHMQRIVDLAFKGDRT